MTTPLLKVSDVAELLQVTTAFVYRHAGELGALKVGRHLRFRASDIEGWLESRRMGEPSWEAETFPTRPQTVPQGWMSQGRGRSGSKRPPGRSGTTGGR